MDQSPEMAYAPGVPPNHVRVWCRTPTGEVGYWDFPHRPGMLIRDLRVLVARESQLNVFALGLTNSKAQLIPLDSPLEAGQRLFLSIGPLDSQHMFGPFLSRTNVTCMAFGETVAAILPLGLTFLLETPVENVLNRMIRIAVQEEGTRLTVMQVIRRVKREEGLAALWRGAAYLFALVAANALGGLAVALYIPPDSSAHSLVSDVIFYFCVVPL